MMVSILVLVDFSLKLTYLIFRDQEQRVSILVLVDFSLKQQQHGERIYMLLHVSILVLVDFSLKQENPRLSIL